MRRPPPRSPGASPSPRLIGALLAAFVASLLSPCPHAAAGEGLAVEGSDHVHLRLEAGAPRLEEYANAGYGLHRVSPAPEAAGGSAAGEEWVVEVTLSPLASAAPFAPAAEEAGAPAGDGVGKGGESVGGEGTASSDGPLSVARLARQVTAGAEDRYAAVSAVLGWMVGHLMEEGAAPALPSHGAAQTPEAVLARGGGDDRGLARLGVALLTEVGIEARVVRGWVLGAPEIGAPHGPHTWIEVYYPDRGWTFSDPLRFHHYVPATYLRLAPAAAAPQPAAAAPRSADGTAAAANAGARWSELLERRDRRQTVDLYPAAGPGVSGRKNGGEQVAGALRVVVSGAGRGSAVLAGSDARLSRALVGGESVFVGLRGGTYRLEVYLEGRPPLIRQIELAPRQRTAVFLRDAQVSQRSAAPGKAGPEPGTPARRSFETQASNDTSRPAP